LSSFDFETSAGPDADELTYHVPPDTETQADDNAVTLGRRQSRQGLPSQLRPEERYEKIAVDKLVLGRLESPTE
jgi:hypothetical protein